MYCQTGSPFPPWVPIPQFDLNFFEENLQEFAVHFPNLVAGLLPEFGHLTGQILLQAALDLLLQQVNVFSLSFSVFPLHLLFFHLLLSLLSFVTVDLWHALSSHHSSDATPARKHIILSAAPAACSRRRN